MQWFVMLPPIYRRASRISFGKSVQYYRWSFVTLQAASSDLDGPYQWCHFGFASFELDGPYQWRHFGFAMCSSRHMALPLCNRCHRNENYGILRCCVLCRSTRMLDTPRFQRPHSNVMYFMMLWIARQKSIAIF